MDVVSFETNRLGTNVYLVAEGSSCFIVDPGGQPEAIIEAINHRGWQPEYIILTHGHFDHVAAVQALKEHFQIPVLAHEAEAEILLDPEKNLSVRFGYDPISLVADRWVQEGDQVDFQGQTIRFMHTPGHTQGGMCILVGGLAFTGDTVFKQSVGRTDLYSGSMREILKSLKRVVSLPEATILYPGHGPATDVAFEKANNTFVTRFEKTVQD